MCARVCARLKHALGLSNRALCPMSRCPRRAAWAASTTPQAGVSQRQHLKMLAPMEADACRTKLAAKEPPSSPPQAKTRAPDEADDLCAPRPSPPLPRSPSRPTQHAAFSSVIEGATGDQIVALQRKLLGVSIEELRQATRLPRQFHTC